MNRNERNGKRKQEKQKREKESIRARVLHYNVYRISFSLFCLIMDNQQLRGILVKLESRLSDDDRERLHFFLGNDVPRKIRDDSSLRGTLRLMDSLFDQDKINEQDFTFLIHAFEQIQCLDAVNLLKGFIFSFTVESVMYIIDLEHRRQILSQSIQSLASIMPITIRNMIEDQCFDKYTTHKCKFQFFHSSYI